MTHEEIIEGNRLIAEFLGSKFINDAPEDYPNGYYYQPEEMEGDCPTGIPEDWCFESSWDWLMPVVEQIESLNYSVEIFKSASYDEPDKIWHRCIIEKMTNWTLDLALEEEDDLGKQYIKTDSKILSVWLAVIEFIKWYNQQNIIIPKEEENEIKHIS